jgi:hypothetical protein
MVRVLTVEPFGRLAGEGEGFTEPGGVVALRVVGQEAGEGKFRE